MIMASVLPLAISQVEVNSRWGIPMASRQKSRAGFQGYTNHKRRVWRKREKDILVTRAAHDTGKCFGPVRPTDRLFPDQSGLQYCRRSRYHRHSTLEPVGNLLPPRARFLGCQ